MYCTICVPAVTVRITLPLPPVTARYLFKVSVDGLCYLFDSCRWIQMCLINNNRQISLIFTVYEGFMYSLFESEISLSCMFIHQVSSLVGTASVNAF
jgi:hypothetical protein